VLREGSGCCAGWAVRAGTAGGAAAANVGLPSIEAVAFWACATWLRDGKGGCAGALAADECGCAACCCAALPVAAEAGAALGVGPSPKVCRSGPLAARVRSSRVGEPRCCDGFAAMLPSSAAALTAGGFGVAPLAALELAVPSPKEKGLAAAVGALNGAVLAGIAALRPKSNRGLAGAADEGAALGALPLVAAELEPRPGGPDAVGAAEDAAAAVAEDMPKTLAAEAAVVLGSSLDGTPNDMDTADPVGCPKLGMPKGDNPAVAPAGWPKLGMPNFDDTPDPGADPGAANCLEPNSGPLPAAAAFVSAFGAPVPESVASGAVAGAVDCRPKLNAGAEVAGVAAGVAPPLASSIWRATAAAACSAAFVLADNSASPHPAM
jgi:hypothetical protein